MEKYSLSFIVLAAVVPLLSSCSLDVLPVPAQRVNAAREAEKPVARGPQAPGAFKRSWRFQDAEGYSFEPSRVEFSDGLLKLKATEKSSAKFGTEPAVIESLRGTHFELLDSFTETAGAGNRAEIRYQLSPDGATWWWYDGKNWVHAARSRDQTNGASQINQAISTFHQAAGIGKILIRIYLRSPTGTEPAELREVTIQGIAAKIATE